MQSIIGKGPIIFLKLAQDNYGEIDAFITPASISSLYPYDERRFLNYTAIRNVITEKEAEFKKQGKDITYNFAPRKMFSGVNFRNIDIQFPYYNYANMFLIDTE